MLNPFEQIDNRLASIEKLLSQAIASFNKQNQNDADEVGGVEFAAKLTGLRPSTIYQLTSKRTIPHSRRLKKLYFSKKALMKWIEEAGRPTVYDLQEAASNSKKN